MERKNSRHKRCRIVLESKERSRRALSIKGLLSMPFVLVSRAFRRTRHRSAEVEYRDVRRIRWYTNY